MTFKRRFLRIVTGLAMFGAVALADVQTAHAQVQWNYTFQPNGQAIATYLGDVQIFGNCTGCSGANLLTQPNTWTGTQTFQGAAATLGMVTRNEGETATITAAAPAATTNYDVLSQSVQYYTTNAANNWTLNIRGNGSTSLNAVMAVGQSVSIALVTTQGASPFFQSALTIDGGAVTPKWQGGTAPAAGNASGLDVYTLTIIKTAAATYTVLASLVQFK